MTTKDGRIAEVLKDLRSWAVARPEAIDVRVTSLDEIIGVGVVCVC